MIKIAMYIAKMERSRWVELWRRQKLSRDTVAGWQESVCDCGQEVDEGVVEGRVSVDSGGFG
ncbi:hypothetical protein PM082_024549 [Marasmius tenuissimus]|nr:hypothetical protein PM082_024549 [Marasmius tenuissimus]